MERQMSQLPAVFGALADPTRLAIVERLLREGERSVGEIAEPLPLTLPAISRHIRVLEEAGLLERRIDRQWRRYRVRAQAMQDLDKWMALYRAFWTASLDRLERMMEKRRRK